MTEGPRLSIVIPARDRAAPLAALLEALAAQAAAHPGAVETVVVDDGSDPPLAVPPGVRLLRNPASRGANPARAQGLAASAGAWVHFHDSDDGIAEGWLDAVLAALRGAPDVLVTRRVDEIGGAREPRAQAYVEAQLRRPDRARRMLDFRNCLGPFGGVVFSRRALEGVAFPPIRSSQDWAVYRQVYAKPGLRQAAAPGARFLFRRDGADRISRNPRARVAGMFAIMRLTAGARPFGRLLRIWHLHRFRADARAFGRAELGRLLDRTRRRRRLVAALAVAWQATVLRLR